MYRWYSKIICERKKAFSSRGGCVIHWIAVLICSEERALQSYSIAYLGLEILHIPIESHTHPPRVTCSPNLVDTHSYIARLFTQAERSRITNAEQENANTLCMLSENVPSVLFRTSRQDLCTTAANAEILPNFICAKN